MTLSEMSPSSNHLLGSLSTGCLKLLTPTLESVMLKQGCILYHVREPIRHVYFPNMSAISMVNIFENGSTVEIGLIGREGMLGVSLLSGDNISPHQAIVQIPDGGWRMEVAAFRTNVDENKEFADQIRRYTQALFVQVSQTAACNRMHSIDQRLARWLLLAQERIESDVLELTHEFIATMLGTRRAGVTIAAGKLQESGIIDYHRGKVKILDSLKLQEQSCECHRIVSREYDRLLKIKRRQRTR